MASEFFVQVFWLSCVLIALGQISRHGIPGFYKCIFNFTRNCQTVCKVAVPFCISSNIYSTFLPTLCIVSLFDYSHSSECLVVFHCSLVHTSLIVNSVGNLFMYLSAIWTSFLRVFSNILAVCFGLLSRIIQL